MSDKVVLIISATCDSQHVNPVQAHLNALGLRTLRIDTDRLGIDWGLTFLFDSNHREIVLHTGESDISLFNLEIQSVWFRKPKVAEFNKHLPISSEAELFVQDEWNATLKGLYRILRERGTFWVSDPDTITMASYKPFQLCLAHQIGWKIPQTAISSNPEVVKQFWQRFDKKIVAKSVARGWVTSDPRSEEVLFVLTNEVRDLHDLDQVKISPVIFQRNIPKDYEIRTTVVGQQVFSAKIDSQKSEISKVDWRRYDFANTAWSRMTLPQQVERKCLEIVQRLGLQYGAIDLVKTPDDEYIFLEINPVGQFLWIEHLTGLPISEAIARLLAGLEQPL